MHTIVVRHAAAYIKEGDHQRIRMGGWLGEISDAEYDRLSKMDPPAVAEVELDDHGNVLLHPRTGEPLLVGAGEMGEPMALADEPTPPGLVDDNPPDPAKYDGLTVAELQDELTRRELPTSGLKQELVDRLIANDTEAPPES